MYIPKGGIGFFDSGLGGLTVLSACLPRLGGFPVYYYGDNARAPYGNLSQEEIRRYAGEAFEMFDSLDVRAAVIACNTVTAVCAEELRKKYAFPIVGAEPAVMPAAKAGGKIFILATRTTAESLRLNNLCARARERYQSAELRIFPCDGLAGAVEKYLFCGGGFDFSRFFPKGRPKGVVLGCTHYVFLKNQIRDFYKCPVYDGNAGIAEELLSVLNKSYGYFRDPKPLETTFLTDEPLATTFGKNAVPEIDCDGILYASKENNRFELNAEVLFLSGSLVFKEENIRSRVFSENQQKIPQKSGFFPIFFLGSGKNVNKTACKQMFAMSFKE